MTILRSMCYHKEGYKPLRPFESNHALLLLMRALNSIWKIEQELKEKLKSILRGGKRYKSMAGFHQISQCKVLKIFSFLQVWTRLLDFQQTHLPSQPPAIISKLLKKLEKPDGLEAPQISALKIVANNIQSCTDEEVANVYRKGDSSAQVFLLFALHVANTSGKVYIYHSQSKNCMLVLPLEVPYGSFATREHGSWNILSKSLSRLSYFAIRSGMPVFTCSSIAVKSIRSDFACSDLCQ